MTLESMWISRLIGCEFRNLNTKALREIVINDLVKEERRNPGTIHKVATEFSERFNVPWRLTTSQNAFTTALNWTAGNKKGHVSYCGNQSKYVITPAFLGNLVRYLVEAS